MSAEAEIKSAIRAIVGDPATSKLCKVVSVDEDEMTCEVTPIDGGANYTDVRLMADNEDTQKGIYIKPKSGSIVMITPQDEVTYFVSMYSEVDEVWLHGNQYDGLVKIGDLVTKLNNLENTLNTFITTYNAHTHTVTAVGAPTGPSLAPGPPPLVPTVQIELENTKCKHG